MKLKFRTKLFLLMVISWLCLLGVMVAGTLQTKASRLEEREVALRNIAELADSITKEYADFAKTGKMPIDEAKAQALARIKALRFAGDGYVTVIRSAPFPSPVMHPINASLNGKDMSDFKDSKGTYIYREIATIAKGAGAGTVSYVWPRPGAKEGEAVPKLAYVFTYQPWDWSFMVGIYLDDLTDAFYKDIGKSAMLLLFMGIALTVMNMGIIRSIERSIGGDPEAAAKIALDIAEGNLTTEMSVQYGDHQSMLFSMKTMQSQLVSTLGTIQVAAKAIATATVQISQGNNDLSSRTEAQAGTIEETASTMEELTSTVKHNVDNARQANQLALAAASVAAQSGAVVGNVIKTMGSINESSKKITDITGVIDGIAFQTNILSLNAAVEAARAGEQGRGFAVVASEVRSLAQRAANAAKEIKLLINDSVEKVETGSKLVAEAGTTMDELVRSVKKVTDIMTEILTSSQEQSAGIEQVNFTLAQMDNETQKNAALVEEAAATAESMQQQATSLTEAVAVFKLGHVLDSTQ